MSGVPPVLVQVVRDGWVESEHRGDLAICDVSGRVVAGVGDPDRVAYMRSSVKPLQTLAAIELLAESGLRLDQETLAVASASHGGSADQQRAVSRLLAAARLDENALQCPPDLPVDLAALRRHSGPTRLAHNCSGKHAAFLYAHTAQGGDPREYLAEACPVQQAVRAWIAAMTGTEPDGPGTDGCGAPAWLLPVRGLATAFARLAAGVDGDERPADPVAEVRAAMTARPVLVGHAAAPDTQLMIDVAGLVAKRGAEGVMAAGWNVDGRAVGMAVKISDGAARAAAVAAAAAVVHTGQAVAEELLHPAVLAGGQPHGRLQALGL